MPNYKLTYFDGRGRAEVVRMLFTAGGVQFTDERVKNWPTGKEGFDLSLRLHFLVHLN
jgi:glutathione S-transferase